MNIALVAFSVRGAMGQYLHCLAEAVAERADTTVHVPSHFEYAGSRYKRIAFRTGHTRMAALARILNPLAGRAVWRAVLAQRPDCVHLFTGEGYPWARLGMAMCTGHGVPTVVTVHDAKSHSGDFWGSVNEFSRRKVLRLASGIHVHTMESCRYIREVVGTTPVCVIRHGDISPAFAQHRRGAVRESRLALFFGRIEAYKGIDLFLKALPLLPVDWRCCIAGPGRMSPEVAALIHSAPPGRLEIINRYLPDIEVAALLEKATVGVLPYRDATQSSLPSLCAAFGLPVVATRVGGFIEDVPLVGGLLVEPGNIEELARGIVAAAGRTPRIAPECDFRILKDDFIVFDEMLVRARSK